jgi:hypothetical protein
MQVGSTTGVCFVFHLICCSGDSNSYCMTASFEPCLLRDGMLHH